MKEKASKKNLAEVGFELTISGFSAQLLKAIMISLARILESGLTLILD